MVKAPFRDSYILPQKLLFFTDIYPNTQGDRDRLRKSTGLSVLMEKVPEVGLYKLGYRRIMNGVISYFEMNTVKTVDENGAVTFILGMRDVDEETRRQLKQTREMEMQREIIEGLGSEYYSILLVNPNAATVTVFRAAD